MLILRAPEVQLVPQGFHHLEDGILLLFVEAESIRQRLHVDGFAFTQVFKYLNEGFPRCLFLVSQAESGFSVVPDTLANSNFVHAVVEYSGILR